MAGRRAATLLAVVASVLGSAVGATPPAAGASPRTVTVICDDLGAVRVAVSGDLAHGGSVRSLDSGTVSLVGRPGLTGRTTSGHPVTVAPSVVGVRCEGLPFRNRRAVDVLPADAVAGLPAAERTVILDGSISLTAVVVAPVASLAAAAPQTTFPYAAQIASYVAGRLGDVTVAVKPVGATTPMVWTRGPARNVTASVVKADVMATVMRRAQEAGRGLTSWETSQLVPMIRTSDNTATANLWSSVGGGPAVARVNALIGLSETTMGPGAYWGLTTTSPGDQTRLLDQFASPSSILTPANRAYALSLMRSVSSSQSWGVTAGPGPTVTAVKNGWLPRTDGWHVNSIGYVAAGPVRYEIGVFTQDPAGGSMATQIATIQGVSRIVWAHESARSDWSGDRKVDTLARTTDGRLTVGVGNGAGGVTLSAPQGAAWSQFRWILSPGDVDLDGHADLMGVTPAGVVALYRGRGGQSFSPRTDVGEVGTDLTQLAAAGDFEGDGLPDLVGVTAAGRLRRYRIHLDGTVTLVGTFSSGWGDTRLLIGPGDVDGDGLADLVRVAAGTGDLSVWRSTRTDATRLTPVRAGMVYGYVGAPGDLDGDGVPDLVAVSAAGELIRFPLTPAGAVLGARGLTAQRIPLLDFVL